MSVLLQAEHVSKHFPGAGFGSPGTVALDAVSLGIDSARPAITAVVGESGSGKTTLARVLLGLIAPTSGRVLYHGQDLTTLDSETRRNFRRDVQAIFQDPYEVYNPFYRVDHVLTTPVRKFRLAQSKAAERDLIAIALRSVGLRPEEILGRYPHQLSGGQRQRIMVARAVLMRPKLIVADEPVSMVDASLRATILGSLAKLNQEMGISIVYITHDLATAYQVSHNLLVMYRAAVVEAGDAERIVQAPQHPYTQLLISAIPQADTNRVWLDSNREAAGTAGPAGCRFAPRCPRADATCIAAAPPLLKVAPDRAVACFRYPDGAVLSELAEVLTGHDKAAVEG